MATNEPLREIWSSGAPAYAEFTTALDPLHEKIRDTVVLKAKAQGRMRVLDVACGDGEPAVSLANRFPHLDIVATDFAEGMVELAKKKAELFHLSNIKFAVADAMDLSAFEDGSFDVVTCVAALFMVPDPDKALREFKRVLKPDGLVVVTVWGTPEECNLATAMSVAKSRLLPSPSPGAVDPSRLSSHQGLSDMLGAAGFSNVDISCGLPPPPVHFGSCCIHDKLSGLGCRNFNVAFHFAAGALTDPHGPMYGHPMMTMATTQLEAAGVHNPKESLSKQIDHVFAEQGYVQKDQTLLFPKNVAIIATGINA